MSRFSLRLFPLYTEGVKNFFAFVVMLERLREAVTLHGDADMHTKIGF